MFRSNLLVTVLLAGIAFPGNLTAEPVSREITGAGAHFSWVVFHGQRQALEKHVKRPLKLYGREQMLGAGCNAGIKMAQANRPGHESFGLVCCQLTSQEIKEKALRVFPVAQEPLLILVNQDNPVSNLSIKQVRNIFRGKVTNWKQVGGKDQAIVLVVRTHCKHRPGHWKTILPKLQQFRKDRINVRSAQDMVVRVNDFSGAIGHTGSAWQFAKGSRVKAITVSGYKPTAENIKKKRYPFFRTLSAVTSKSASKDVINLIESARSSKEFYKIAKQYELSPVKTK